MKEEDFEKLKRGDIVKNRGSHKSYLVTGNYGISGVVLVRTMLAMNPGEWDKLS